MMMKQNTEKRTRTCGCCHQEKPLENFYVDKRTLAADSYCKACRRELSKARHRLRALTQEADRHYPVITETADPEERMSLILKALSVVRESMMRKRTRQEEALMTMSD
ncbi:MAG: hypothetical protein HUK10_10590 [Bacteroides heparinolyticus]|nr:hypothetical protein [Bacteroides heparinolyticus]